MTTSTNHPRPRSAPYNAGAHRATNPEVRMVTLSHVPRARMANVGVAALLTLALAGCGSSNGGSNAAASTTTSASTGTTITIKSFKFTPNPLKVRSGDTVTITNTDATDHTVSADDKSFDTGKFSEGSKTIKLDTAGTYSFHCNVHDFMKGVIQVEG
jgi:plastocyanin